MDYVNSIIPIIKSLDSSMYELWFHCANSTPKKKAVDAVNNILESASKLKRVLTQISVVPQQEQSASDERIKVLEGLVSELKSKIDKL